MVKEDFVKTGLSLKEVKTRLEKFGPNELEEKKEFSSLKLFLSQFKSPLIYILVFAGTVTLFLRDFSDTIIIFAAVFLNTILGFYQELKAQKALAALRKLLSHKAKVIRDNQQREVKASELVPGDVVILNIGTRIPADGILLQATDFSVNEAILTGESMPVKKAALPSEVQELKLKSLVDQTDQPRQKWEKENQVFMGTIVVTGLARILVTKTGMATEMGKIGQSLVEIREEKTPLQVQLAKLAKILAIFVGIASATLFIGGLLSGYDPLVIFTTSVAVAVAAIPEGLVVALTVILALGMQRILARKALVRRLISAETLGSVSVICIDKTGTLTEGQLKVVKADFTDEKMGQKAAILCNDLHDPLEIEMLAWAQRKASEKGFKTKEAIVASFPRLQSIPFSPQYRYIATLHPGVLFISGAPEVILSKSKLAPDRRKNWQEKFDSLGRQGYRLVGFAYKEVGKGKRKIEKKDLDSFSWLGILAYEDPVRTGVRQALEESQKAGIKIKVITGDYLSTAIAVLEKLGFKLNLQEEVMEGEQLETLSPAEFDKRVSKVVLFARTNPSQKLKIVEALKKKGEVVAMTGDGVNDAPALKMADIGIVVGEASDVARETADMVLLDSRFSTIVHAIEEGRTIFENIKKVVLYLLSAGFTEIILISGSLVLGLPLPVTAAQILWVNLAQDGLPAMALAFEPGEKDVMDEPPRPRHASILDRQVKTLILIVGVMTDIVLLALFYWLNRGLFHFEHIQTIMFVALSIGSLFVVNSCRSLRKTIWQRGFFGNKLILIALVSSFLLLILGVHLPVLQKLLSTQVLDWREWLFLIAFGVFNLIAIEVTKWVFIVRRRRYTNSVKQ